ncbi:MAG: RluA family pseudouridine synthase [Spirochaetes bacterium]|nr:RluA family pseudouridine synthase [Spirochaetota bacterium]
MPQSGVYLWNLNRAFQVKKTKIFCKVFLVLAFNWVLQKLIIMQIEALYEDNHIIAINKPSGLLTQSDFSGQTCAYDEVKSYIKKKYDKKGDVFLGIVHRLDRQVSGVLVFARTSKAASRLFSQFNERRVIKLYCGIVEWHTTNIITLNTWHEIHTPLRRLRDITVPSQVASADFWGEMRIKIIHKKDAIAFVLIHLITGKKHQIRAQLSSIGLPILGDTKYGAKIKTPPDTICLHSLFVEFDHPTRKTPISINAPIPQIFYQHYSSDLPIFDIEEIKTELHKSAL